MSRSIWSVVRRPQLEVRYLLVRSVRYRLSEVWYSYSLWSIVCGSWFVVAGCSRLVGNVPWFVVHKLVVLLFWQNFQQRPPLLNALYLSLKGQVSYSCLSSPPPPWKSMSAQGLEGIAKERESYRQIWQDIATILAGVRPGNRGSKKFFENWRHGNWTWWLM